ncbi:hypothetical protein GCM10023147_51420 [Tsukamurella soli]|uniref:DNA-binding transcriptional regulator, MarR family n=2 Tax=Tsukamurella soli TaxID=644556 RepID=A0ABP8KJ94_9ACTN
MQPPDRQPLGFWTLRAGETIRARTRGALAEIGVTQPEWWVLHQLSLHPGGVPRDDVIGTVGPNDTPEAIVAALRSVAANGWSRDDGATIALTTAGRERFERAAEVQAALQRERMQGISTEDFATTITVLQKTIDNLGGTAWHW